MTLRIPALGTRTPDLNRAGGRKKRDVLKNVPFL